MPPRKLAILALLLIIPALLAVAACGGGGDDDDTSFQPGRLTNPEDAPTATPWDSPPDIVLLDPDNIQPLPPDNPITNGDGEETPTPEPGEPGVCGETYTVVAGDTVFGIADNCGVDPDEIIALNPDIDPASLSIGQVINLPPADSGDGGDNTQ